MSNLKSFIEAINDIKEGEIYTDRCTEISKFNKKIKIRNVASKLKFESFTYDEDYRNFKLKRKEYTFQEAFEAYEEGKEIESCYNNCRYVKKRQKEYYCDSVITEWYENTGFGLREIRGKWYINDLKEGKVNE